MENSLKNWESKGFVLDGNNLVKKENSIQNKKVHEVDSSAFDRVLKGKKIVKTFNITPFPAPRMTKSDKWKTDPNHPDPNKRQRVPVFKYFQFKNKLKELLGNENIGLTDELKLIFVLPMANSWSKNKKKLMNKTPHKQKPDFDNLAKAFCDSFGIDDSHVWNARISKFWGYKGAIIIYDNIN
jgi:Holliday junction resolvase RusA-like endonuclease